MLVFILPTESFYICWCFCKTKDWKVPVPRLYLQTRLIISWTLLLSLISHVLQRCSTRCVLVRTHTLRECFLWFKIWSHTARGDEPRVIHHKLALLWRPSRLLAALVYFQLARFVNRWFRKSFFKLKERSWSKVSFRHRGDLSPIRIN